MTYFMNTPIAQKFNASARTLSGENHVLRVMGKMGNDSRCAHLASITMPL